MFFYLLQAGERNFFTSYSQNPERTIKCTTYSSTTKAQLSFFSSGNQSIVPLENNTFGGKKSFTSRRRVAWDPKISCYSASLSCPSRRGQCAVRRFVACHRRRRSRDFILVRPQERQERIKYQELKTNLNIHLPSFVL